MLVLTSESEEESVSSGASVAAASVAAASVAAASVGPEGLFLEPFAKATEMVKANARIEIGLIFPVLFHNLREYKNVKTIYSR